MESLTIRDGLIWLRAMKAGPQDPRCCPTQPFNAQLRLANDTLIATPVATSVAAVGQPVAAQFPAPPVAAAPQPAPASRADGRSLVLAGAGLPTDLSAYDPALPILDNNAAYQAWFAPIQREYDSIVTAYRPVRTPYDTEQEYRTRVDANVAQLRPALAAFYARPAQAYFLVPITPYGRRYNAETQRLTAMTVIPLGMILVSEGFDDPSLRTNGGRLVFAISRDTARSLDVVGAPRGLVKMRVVVEPCTSGACRPMQPLVRAIETEYWVGSTMAGSWRPGAAAIVPSGAPASATTVAARVAIADTVTGVCADRPRCRDRGGFQVEVTRVNPTEAGANRDLEFVVRLRNTTDRRLVVGYVPGSLAVTDEFAVRYTATPIAGEEARCIGTSTGTGAVPPLGLAAGASEVVLLKARGPAIGNPGTVFAVEFALAEVDMATGRPQAGPASLYRFTEVSPPRGLRAMVEVRTGCAQAARR